MKNPATEAPRRGHRSALAIGSLCLVQFVDVLGVTVVITALPSILRGLGSSASSAPLVVTGYAMLFGGLLMLGARLGDRYGHRRVLLAGVGAFGVASLLAATAPSLAALITARCLQGAAAALSVPTALRLLLATAHGADARRRALAGWSAAGATAGATGFLLGGVLTELAGWRLVFWVNLPLAALLASALIATTAQPPQQRRIRLDLAGAAALTCGVMALVGGASLLEHPGGRPLGALVAAAGAALLGAFVVIERRVAEPLLPVAALRHPHLRRGAGASALNTATTSSAMMLATLYVQDERGASPTGAALLLVPFSLCVVGGSSAAARVLRDRPASAGIALGLGTIGLGVTVLLAVPSAAWLLPLGVALAGLGLGVSSVAANSLGMDVPSSLQGTASGALNTAAQLGTALGVSFLLLVATASSHSALPLTGPSLGWACAAALALTSAWAAARGGLRSPNRARQLVTDGSTAPE